MSRAGVGRGLCTALAFVLCLAAKPAAAQWQVESKDGTASLRFGFLLQPQAEAIGTSDGEATSSNLFIRRMRLLFGGKIAGKWSFFVDTDSPNLGKANPDKNANPAGAKDAGNMFLQDAVLTWDNGDMLKVDAGMILMPLSHNHLQGAPSLLPIDYSPYTFQESGPLGERVGRDYGAQIRGYLNRRHFEYRLGVFQGVRGVEARNPFRFTGRAVYYVYGPDTGFFYGGTWQGTCRTLGVGTYLDRQREYRSYGADVMVEQPFSTKTGGITGQFNWMRFDGNTFLPSLPRQDSLAFETAVHLLHSRIAPFFEYASLNYQPADLHDQDVVRGGLLWWIRGHNRNIKFSVGRIHADTQPNRMQVAVQLQAFYY
jgi:hypothetical protein